MMKTQVPSTLSKNLRPMDAVKLAALISKIVQNWEYRLPNDVNY